MVLNTEMSWSPTTTFYHRICLTINKLVHHQHLLVSFEELLSLRLSDHFALVVGCINNNGLNLWKKDACKVFTGVSPPLWTWIHWARSSFPSTLVLVKGKIRQNFESLWRPEKKRIKSSITNDPANGLFSRSVQNQRSNSNRSNWKNGFCIGVSWPAISDIWLGIRTVPVLSVAEESRGASQIAHWPRSARTQAGRCGLTDRRSSVKKLLSFVRLLMVPSLLEEITGHGMPVECSKLTCFAKVKIRHGSRAVRSTIEVGRCQSLFAYCEAEFDFGKVKNTSKATDPHWKDENNNHHWQTNPNSHVYESESQSDVDVRWPAMYE